jgi:hypothetical protein
MSAFPTISFDSLGQITSFDGGMKLRDYFASHAMQALISIPSLGMNAYDEYAVCAYQYADAMMKARENKNGK